LPLATRSSIAAHVEAIGTNVFMGLPSSFSGNSVYGVCLAQEDGQWIFWAVRTRSEMNFRVRNPAYQIKIYIIDTKILQRLIESYTHIFWVVLCVPKLARDLAHQNGYMLKKI
jgi:hypothetical protein